MFKNGGDRRSEKILRKAEEQTRKRVKLRDISRTTCKTSFEMGSLHTVGEFRADVLPMSYESHVRIQGIVKIDDLACSGVN